MQSGVGDAGTTAQVIPLGKLRSIRDQGCLLTAACPGWSISFQQRSDLWIAQRRMGVWVCDLSTAPRTCILTDSNPVTLFLRINFQAIHDLAGEFPSWKVDQAAATGLWVGDTAIWPAGGPAMICAESPVRLVHQVRAFAAAIGETSEPWFALWGDPSDG
jgi:hypothetical protein